jgi:hypothetical protein
MAIDTNNEALCKLAVAFDLGEQAIGEVRARIMLVKTKNSTWNLRATRGPMNVWGLDRDEVWKYKKWAPFRTPREAVEAFNRSLLKPKWAEMPDKAKDLKDW